MLSILLMNRRLLNYMTNVIVLVVLSGLINDEIIEI